jgi:SpoVK/Ycf46/Vps4 family AAA+-type ATPase
MDGLRDDADVLFILITNRPEEAEEALASRPGLVGEAIEIANPDAACRSRLVTLYGQALAFEDGAVDATAARSEGRVRPSSRRWSTLSRRPHRRGRRQPDLGRDGQCSGRERVA